MAYDDCSIPCVSPRRPSRTGVTDNNGPQVFEYTTLPSPTHIRLLRLLGEQESLRTIHCSIDVFNLNEAPPFRALSYTWDKYEPLPSGKPRSLPVEHDEPSRGNEDLPSILCNGKTLEVRPNLFDALQEINKAQQVGYLWIDAICIHQNDIEERNTQVGQMGRIYRTAESVIVWLGLEGEDSRTYSVFMSDTWPALNAFVEKQGYKLPHNIYDPRLWELLELPRMEIMSWFWIIDFLARPWFTRAWVVQECSLAKEIIVLCGAVKYLWDELIAFANFLDGSGWDLSLVYFTRKQGSPPGGSFRLLALTRYELQNSEDFTVSPGDQASGSEIERSDEKRPMIHYLFDIVQRFRPRMSTDPRDKIFSNVGMLEMFPSKTNTMKPDYSKDAATVYTEYATYVLKQTSSLKILSQVENPIWRQATRSKVTGLPSWVPAFDVAGGQVLATKPPKGSYFAAGPSAKHTSIEVADNRFLILEGALLDWIEDVGLPLTTLPLCKDSIDCLEPILGLDPIYVNGQNRLEVLWRTVFADTFNDKYPLPLEFGKKFARFWLYLSVNSLMDYDEDSEYHASALSRFERFEKLACVDSQSDFPTASRVVEAQEAWLEARAKGSREYLDAQNELYGPIADVTEVAEKVTSMGLFRTKLKFSGLGCDSARVGDSIWVLQGANVPFILRPIPETGKHQLIGECYVHGFMRGELLERKDVRFEKVIIQ